MRAAALYLPLRIVPILFDANLREQDLYDLVKKRKGKMRTVTSLVKLSSQNKNHLLQSRIIHRSLQPLCCHRCIRSSYYTSR